MVVHGGHQDTNTVTMDEANILADFFNLQANKHGPEMVRKLNNIGGLKVSGQESRGVGEKQSQSALEQRKQIKIEVEAENVINQEIKLEQGRGQSGAVTQPGLLLQAGDNPLQLLLHSQGVQGGPGTQGESGQATQIQYLLSHHGKLVPLIPEAIVKNLTGQREQSNSRGVSVIQRAPGRQQTPASPNIILSRRVSEVSVYSPHSPPAGTGESRHRMIDITTAGSQDTSPATGLSTLSGNSLLESKTGSITNSGLKGRKSNQQQSDHLICEVCGERAGKHSYYGGQVCPSCRAFFRRSVQSRYNETFKCTKGREECTINLMTRKNCQFCRYQKCLQAGMRPSWILSDEERVRRFHGRVRGEKSKAYPLQEPEVMEYDEDTTTSPSDTAISGSGSVDSDSFSSESREINSQVVMEFCQQMRKVWTGRHDDLEPGAVTELITVTLQGTSLTQHTALLLNNVLEARTRQCIQLLPEFQSLHEEDQRTILAQNLPLVHRFRQALCLHCPRLTWRRMVQLLIGDNKLREEAHNLPTDLSGKQVETEGFQYCRLFTAPWYPSPEMEMKTKSLMEDIAGWVDFHDELQITLLVLILAFNHDFLDLRGRCQVEKIQLKFVLLLQTHLQSIHTSSLAASKLTKAVMLAAVTRELVQLTKKKLII